MEMDYGLGPPGRGHTRIYFENLTSKSVF